jgi:hypothetical protein
MCTLCDNCVTREMIKDEELRSNKAGDEVT